MLAVAAGKRIYRELHEAEATEFLLAASARWNLVVATDVLIYMPDPRTLFAATLPRLMPGGYFAFTIELSASG